MRRFPLILLLASGCAGFGPVNHLFPTPDSVEIPESIVTLRNGSQMRIRHTRITRDSVVGYKDRKRTLPVGVPLSDLSRVERASFSRRDALSVTVYLGFIYACVAVGMRGW